MKSFGFPPISSPSARVLVLGSLPGRLSLERAEYYANPQNAFWKIMSAHNPDLPSDYAGRVAALIDDRIALWDVLAAATRVGSLDAAIADDAIPNNFRAYFHAHPNIELVVFNGATAAKLYERHVVPSLTREQRAIRKQTLPSTSGAHASLPVAEKTVRWSLIVSARLRSAASVSGCPQNTLRTSFFAIRTLRGSAMNDENPTEISAPSAAEHGALAAQEPPPKEPSPPKEVAEAKVKMQTRLPALADDSDVGVEKKQIVTRDGKADLAFTGTLLASAAPASAPNGRWQEYRVYVTNGGKHVFSKVARSVFAEDKDTHEADIFDPAPSSMPSQLLRSARDLTRSKPVEWTDAAAHFFGYDPLAKALYRKLSGQFEEHIS